MVLREFGVRLGKLISGETAPAQERIKDTLEARIQKVKDQQLEKMPAALMLMVPRFVVDRSGKLDCIGFSGAPETRTDALGFDPKDAQTWRKGVDTEYVSTQNVTDGWLDKIAMQYQRAGSQEAYISPPTYVDALVRVMVRRNNKIEVEVVAGNIIDPKGKQRPADKDVLAKVGEAAAKTAQTLWTAHKDAPESAQAYHENFDRNDERYQSRKIQDLWAYLVNEIGVGSATHRDANKDPEARVKNIAWLESLTEELESVNPDIFERLVFEKTHSFEDSSTNDDLRVSCQFRTGIRTHPIDVSLLDKGALKREIERLEPVTSRVGTWVRRQTRRGESGE